MPFIREAKPLNEVFALTTPQHMLMKLAWEIGQFERALAAERDQLDWFPVAA
jgi:hypothetical protein